MDLVQAANTVAWVVMALITLVSWRQRPTAPSGWLAAAFGSVGLVVLLALLPADQLAAWAQKLLLLVLVLPLVSFPYFLFRFAAAFEPPSRRALGTVTGSWIALLAAGVVVAIASPSAFEPTNAGAVAYTAAVIVFWGGLSGWAAVRLWRGGKRQSALARNRMRLLAIAATIMALAVLASGMGGEGGFVAQLSQWLGIGAGVAFILGFAPPTMLREMWRVPEKRALGQVERELLTADSRREVLEIALPHAIWIVAGNGGAFLDEMDSVIVADGLEPDVAGGMAGSAARLVQGEPTVVDGGLIVPLQLGTLVIRSTPYAPFFGIDELDILMALGAYVDVAVRSLALVEQERAARENVQWTNRELEALVYGISHDLRSPLISMQAYLEFLRTDHAEALNEDARMYLERMQVNATYMDALITDLLELSRIGRTRVHAEDVDAAELVREVVTELRREAPAARFEIGDLPRVHMSRLRLRQLLGNLLENAVRHGGRPDIVVRLGSVRTPDGGVRLTIADNGAGIPVEYRERVFGVFERLDTTSTDGGTGIGLAISRKIVEELGGRITIGDSDVGTLIEIQLPRSVAGADVATLEVAQ